jgi:hypothetical protein
MSRWAIHAHRYSCSDVRRTIPGKASFDESEPRDTHALISQERQGERPPGKLEKGGCRFCWLAGRSYIPFFTFIWRRYANVCSYLSFSKTD